MPLSVKDGMVNHIALFQIKNHDLQSFTGAFIRVIIHTDRAGFFLRFQGIMKIFAEAIRFCFGSTD